MTCERLTPEQADLVAEHHFVATQAAVQAAGRWPAADKGDLLSYAFLGLIDAAHTFDPNRGVTFVGYARHIVKHRIVDEWRREHGRRPGLTIRPFDPTADDLGRDIVLAASSVDLGLERVEDAAHAAAVVAELLPELRMRDRFVLVEIGDGATLTEIADRIGVTESRVSQLRAAVAEGRRHDPTVCDVCSRPYAAAQPKHQRYCSPECQAEARRIRRRRRRATVVCGHCGKGFRQIRTDQVWCSRACLDAEFYARKRERVA